jgi:hypothetical protein
MSISWEDMKGFAAIWGAGLSTLTALGLFLSGRPVVVLEPCGNTPAESLYSNGTKQRLCLRILNQSTKDVLQITRRFFFGVGRNQIGFGRVSYEHVGNDRQRVDLIVDDLEAFENSRNFGKFPLYVGRDSSVVLGVNGIEKQTFLLGIFLYHRHGIVPWLPKTFFISWRRAEQINKGNRYA